MRREAVGGRHVDAEAAFAWRDFMVSGYDDSGQASWAESEGIDVIRGEGRIAGRGQVDVDGTTLTADHIVVATGSEAVMPPIDGLAGLDGVWTNREATGLTEVPRRLLVLGGGPVGVEMAQALARMGGSVALVEGMDHVLPREPKPLGEALGEALAAEGIELRFGQHASAVRREGGEFVLEFPDGQELRGDRLLVATGRRPRIEDIGLENVGIEPGTHGHPGRRADARRRGRVGDRRRDRHLAAHLRRQVPGPDRGRQHPRAGSARRTTTPCRASSSPTRRPRRSERPTAG